MSIKIRNGYKIKKEYFDDVQIFNQSVQQYRENCFLATSNLLKSQIEEQLSSFFLHYFIFGEFKDYFNINTSQSFLCENLYNVSIFDILNKSIYNETPSFYSYILFYNFEDFFLCIIDNNLNVSIPSIFKPYIYYNSSDKPDSISKREWNKREQLWNLALQQPNKKIDIVDDIVKNYLISDSINSITYVNMYKKLKIKASDQLFSKLKNNQPDLEIMEYIELLNDGQYNNDIFLIMEDMKKNIPSEYLSKNFFQKFKFDVINNKILFKYID